MSNLGPFSRGDDVVLKHTVTDANGAAQDLTGCTLWLTGKRNRSDADAVAVFQLDSNGHGIAIQSPASAGIAISTIPKTATEGLTKTTRVYWDLQLKDAAGNVSTVDSGSFTIDLDVTVKTT